ncbi:aldehyde dehydrogenase family protein [Mycoplasma phocoenae]|uniref:aldehyde dehydrogenase family protein n=1 Tax=Mycoplasma phocoenae TaxID=754517 RepID=UPI0023503FE3|nr:aldehyde dehydrogenase family protein [Mycoplasma phocoenae]
MRYCNDKRTDRVKTRFNFFFTGSEFVGRKIATKAASLGIEYILELGSPCPVYIDKNVNIKSAAKRIVWAKMYNSGQTCVSPNHFLVHESVYDEFKQELQIQLNKQYPNLWVNNDYSHIINIEQLNNIMNYFQNTHNIFISHNDLKIIPQIVDCDIDKNKSMMTNEMFSNIFALFKIRDKKQALDLFNSLNNSALASYVFTNNKQTIDDFIKNTNSGSLAINDALIHISELKLPFGGIKSSGQGRYRHKFSITSFSNARSYYISRNLNDFSSRFAPFTRKKYNFLRKIIK